MNLEKLYRIQAQHDELADARRARSEAYQARINRSRELCVEATWNALPDYRRNLAALNALPEHELREAGVDLFKLRRAAFERQAAEELLRCNAKSEKQLSELSALLRNLRDYSGVME